MTKSCPRCGKNGVDIHTCSPKPTPETDVQSLVNRLNNAETYVDAIDDAIDMMRRLERERDEAKLWIEKSNTVQYVMQVEAERDQLRKVADELESVVSTYDNQFGWKSTVLTLYSQLPHVKESKTK
jgi:hypothetical protein